MNEESLILVVDDEESTRFLLQTNLAAEGFHVLTAPGAREALKILGSGAPVDLVLSDQIMPGMDGLDLLREMKVKFPSVAFIVLTAYGSVEGAVSAMKEGAQDYIRKPWKSEGMLLTIRRVLENRRVREENLKLRTQLRSLYGFGQIVTRSPAMTGAMAMAAKVAATPHTTVAIFGESGTGKEILARAIHYSGDRLENPFVSVNCAGLPHTLLESELFGHVKGAFTGADREREGRFGTARGGTLLLDEIGDMPMDLQVKLLRVLEERTYEKVGSDKRRDVGCRVIVATNRNLQTLVKEGRFREDLYHRVNVFPIALPPLRERRDDIPLLAERFLASLRSQLGKRLPGISRRAMDEMLRYDWPGNVRELKNCLERAAILSDEELIRPDHLAIGVGEESRKPKREKDSKIIDLTVDLESTETTLDRVVEELLRRTLEVCGNNKSLAAEKLKVNRKMFYRRT
jgi:DNA-binding NtrC family response regulator